MQAHTSPYVQIHEVYKQQYTNQCGCTCGIFLSNHGLFHCRQTTANMLIIINQSNFICVALFIQNSNTKCFTMRTIKNKASHPHRPTHCVETYTATIQTAASEERGSKTRQKRTIINKIRGQYPFIDGIL